MLSAWCTERSLAVKTRKEAQETAACRSQCECFIQETLSMNGPADVINGDVPQLLIHGRLALPAGVSAESGLKVFVGHMDFNFTASF